MAGNYPDNVSAGDPNAPWNWRPTPLVCDNVDCGARADGDADPYAEGDECDDCTTGHFVPDESRLDHPDE